MFLFLAGRTAVPKNSSQRYPYAVRMNLKRGVIDFYHYSLFVKINKAHLQT